MACGAKCTAMPVAPLFSLDPKPCLPFLLYSLITLFAAENLSRVRKDIYFRFLLRTLVQCSTRLSLKAGTDPLIRPIVTDKSCNPVSWAEARVRNARVMFLVHGINITWLEPQWANWGGCVVRLRRADSQPAQSLVKIIKVVAKSTIFKSKIIKLDFFGMSSSWLSIVIFWLQSLNFTDYKLIYSRKPY